MLSVVVVVVVAVVVVGVVVCFWCSCGRGFVGCCGLGLLLSLFACLLFLG